MDIMRMGDEPKFLGSWDLYELPNQRIKATIREIRVELVEDTKGQKKEKAVMYFAEDIKRGTFLHFRRQKHTKPSHFPPTLSNIEIRKMIHFS